MKVSKPCERVNVNKIFVYGTLRPDIKAPWSDRVYHNDKFHIKHSKAYIQYASLQLFKYHKYSNLRIDRKWLDKNNIVHGYILESSNIDETLSLFDQIEDYPTLYNRIITTCYNEQEQREENVFVYIININNLIMKEAFECIYNDYKLISI